MKKRFRKADGSAIKFRETGSAKKLRALCRKLCDNASFKGKALNAVMSNVVGFGLIQ